MSKKLLIANNVEGGDIDNYNHYLQTYEGYPLIVESDKLCTDHPSYITEIYGNTTQDETDLTDIRSVGVLQEDGTYKVDILANNQDSTLTQTQSIYLPQPLRAIGNYSDRLYWDDSLSKYCIEQNIGVEIFDGSDDENWRQQANFTNFVGETSYIRMQYSKPCDATSSQLNTILCMSDNFEAIPNSSYKTLSKHIERDINNINILIDGNDLISADITGFKQWLSENPTTVYYYQTSQTVETSITEKIAIDTYNPYMQITTDELEVAPSNISGEFAEKELLE